MRIPNEPMILACLTLPSGALRGFSWRAPMDQLKSDQPQRVSVRLFDRQVPPEPWANALRLMMHTFVALPSLARSASEGRQRRNSKGMSCPLARVSG